MLTLLAIACTQVHGFFSQPKRPSRQILGVRFWLSSLLTNHCQISVTIHRLWPHFILIQTEDLLRRTSIQGRSMLQMFRSSWSGGAQSQTLSETCPLPLHTSFFPHHLPLLFKTYVVFGYGVVLRPKPTTRTLLVQQCTPDPDSVVISAAS